MAEGHSASFDDGAIPGHEVAGEDVAVGTGVTRIAMGDSVAVLPYLSCGECVSCRQGDPSAAWRRGMISAPGFCGTPDSFTPMAAMVKEATLHFTCVYDTREFEIAVEALDNGHVEPRAMITDVVDLAGAPDAFEELRGRNNQCKVMIRPS